MSDPVTPTEMLALRHAIQKVLGLPRSGRAAIVIVVDEDEDEDDLLQHLGCMGLNQEGIAHVLARALETVLAENPTTIGELVAPALD